MKGRSLQVFGLVVLVALASCHRTSPRRNTRILRRADSGLSPCDHLDRKCVAKADSVARIPGIRWTIAPPVGWRFAEESDATVISKGPTAGALLAVATIEPNLVSAAGRKARVRALDGLARRFGIELRRGSTMEALLREPPGTLEVAGASLQSWESEGAHRVDARGNAVVVAGPLGDGEVVLIAFAPEGDFGVLSESITSLKRMRSSDR